MKKTISRIAVILVIGAIVTQMTTFRVNAEEGTLTGKSANDIVAMMDKGWNLGNTLDATGGNKTDIYSHETAWGNPKITKELIDGVKAAGFTTIRIPITWADYIDKNNGYEIYPEYMARVKEVVDYAYEDGLFVIINVHHEEWVNRKDIDTAYVETGKELTAVWKQIADTFADYDQHLIFEGMNEPRAQGTSYEWTGTAACYDAVNYLDQLFVETIRANGNGYNSERVLMIPGYAASSNPVVLKSIKLPEIDGETASNICVSVHCYSPYDFCLTDNQTSFDGKNSGDTADIKTLFNNLNSLFVNNGIPVVIGECGATNSGNNNSARQAWFAFMGGIATEYNIPAIVWDNGVNGTSGGECHYYFNRTTGEAYSQDLIDAFLEGAISLKAEDVVIDFEPSNDGSHSSLLDPAELGFSNKLFTQMKINHTDGVAMGFSLKVDADVPDYTACYDIGRFKGHTIRIGAWLYSEDDATVSVGVNGENNSEMANILAGTEWKQVCFDVEVPEAGNCELYFKGNAKFYVDDISIEMDPAEPLESIDNNANDTQTDAEDALADDGSALSSANESDNNASSSKAPLVIGIIAALAAACAFLVVKRKK